MPSVVGANHRYYQELSPQPREYLNTNSSIGVDFYNTFIKAKATVHVVKALQVKDRSLKHTDCSLSLCNGSTLLSSGVTF